MLDPLTLDQLRVLLAVADTGSFSAAARKLGRVQSAISQSVQSLETTLGIPLFDRAGKVPRLNDAGRVILDDARRLVAGAQTLRARAESIADDVEPELTLAVDSIFPIVVLTRCLAELNERFPDLPVTLFTEGLGGPEQRLRDGVARLAFCLPLPSRSPDHSADFLVTVPTVPVVAASHRLAAESGPIPMAVMEDELQLVLTDRTSLTAGIGGSIVSNRIWRFADLGTRLDFLLAGFGWCHMPVHMVRDHVRAGRLKVLDIVDTRPPELPLSIVHPRSRPPGAAGRWLIAKVRESLSQCVEPMTQVEWLTRPAPAEARGGAKERGHTPIHQIR